MKNLNNTRWVIIPSIMYKILIVNPLLSRLLPNKESNIVSKYPFQIMKLFLPSLKQVQALLQNHHKTSYILIKLIPPITFLRFEFQQYHSSPLIYPLVKYNGIYKTILEVFLYCFLWSSTTKPLSYKVMCFLFF